MDLHYSLSDAEFIHDFENCKLDPSWFTHEAHLRIGFLYIQQLGSKLAAQKLCTGIARFDRIFGNGDKFHRTITVASIGILSHFMRKSAASDFISFIEEYPQLKTDFKRLLHTHYSGELLSTSMSKSTYILPDLLENEVFEEVNS